MWYGKNDGKWEDVELAPRQPSANEVIAEINRLRDIRDLKELLEELFNERY
jgi:hypothetical protein